LDETTWKNCNLRKTFDCLVLLLATWISSYATVMLLHDWK